MLIVISPAKNLDFQSPVKFKSVTQPLMIDQAKSLVQICKKLSPTDLTDLMGISDKLALLNAERFKEWKLPFDEENSKPAMFAFNGDVYEGLSAKDFDEDDLYFAQDHLRILSGLYGVLRPMDLMQAYRLEMGTKLKNSKGDSLYKFWGSQIADHLNKDLDGTNQFLINLASDEYFKSVDLKALKTKIIKPVFKDFKNGDYKIISFFAKKARGMMARFIIKNKLMNPQQLEEFNFGGYQYSHEESTDLSPVFLRNNVN